MGEVGSGDHTGNLLSLFHNFNLGSLLGKKGQHGQVHHVKNRRTSQSEVVRIIDIVEDGQLSSRRTRQKRKPDPDPDDEEVKLQPKFSVFRELQKLKELRQPNLIQYKSIVLVGFSRYGIIMSPGVASVQTLIPLTCSECKYISQGLISGLEYLHQQQVVHGCISPSSIFLDDHGCVRVGDYGLHSVHARERPGMWSAPEQRTGGEHTTVTMATDVWDVGVTIAHCLLGQLPYRHFKMKNPLEKSPITADFDLIHLVSISMVTDPEQRPSVETLRKMELLSWQEDEEMALKLLDRVGQIRSELTQEILDNRLYCGECGEDSGYSKVFSHQDGTMFLCDQCLEINHGHMDCEDDECSPCHELGTILRQRWRRRESLNKLRSDVEVVDEMNSTELIKPIEMNKPTEMNNNRNDDHAFKIPELPPPRKDVSIMKFSEDYDPENVMQCSLCKMVYDKIENGIISKTGDYTCCSCIEKAS